MTKEKEWLREVLAREVKRWSQKGLSALRNHLENGMTYVTNTEHGAYQTEVTLLEATEDYYHVAISVDDMTLWRGIKPLSTSFISHKDGRVERDEPDS